MKTIFVVFALLTGIYQLACRPQASRSSSAGTEKGTVTLTMRAEANGQFTVYKNGGKQRVLTQVAKENERPYIHPIVAPDGVGELTEYRPGHHPHQTGVFWGLKRVNGRDYFMKWQGDYWKRVSAQITENKGRQVAWRTVYNLLDSTGNVTLVETQNWKLSEVAGKYILDLEWKGSAQTDVTMGKFYVGGLFVRALWTKGTAGEVINSRGQKDKQAEAQRAEWLDVGVAIKGRKDWAHITILDHPRNKAFPTPWRVDNELGVGPSRQIVEDWTIRKSETETIRYQLQIYCGVLNKNEMGRVSQLNTDFYQNRF